MGSRRSSFKSVLFMAVQLMLCEHNEFYQNGHELYSSVAVSAENLKQQNNRVSWVFSHYLSAVSKPGW